MTESKPLKDSPLELLRHRIQKIRLDAHPQPAPDAVFDLTASINVARHAEKPRQWKVTLDVEFGPQDQARPTLYSGAISFCGEFEVSPAFPENGAQRLVEVTGVSMLYGACREAIANLTARAAHGMITLPSVSFFQSNDTQKKADHENAPPAVPAAKTQEAKAP